MYQRKKYAKMQKRIFNLWAQYCEGEKTPMQLLRARAKVNGPVDDYIYSMYCRLHVICYVPF